MRTSPFHQRRGKRLVSDINVVPYIDVMLVLLVIFMVSTPLLTEGVYVELPEAEGEAVEATTEIERMVLSMEKNGKVYASINGGPSDLVDRKTLSSMVRKQLQRNPATEFFVKGDRATPYGKVVKLMADLQASGVPSVGLVTLAPDLEN